MPLHRTTHQDEPPVRYEPPAVSDRSFPILRTTLSVLETLHANLGTCVNGLIRLARDAEEARDPEESDPALRRIWRALSNGIPSRYTMHPRQRSATGLVRESDRPEPVVWGAEIILDPTQKPYVISLNAHACHRHAAIIANAVKNNGCTLTSLQPLLDAFAEWMCEAQCPTTSLPDPAVDDLTADPLDPLLYRALRRATVMNGRLSDARPAATFSLPLRYRTTPWDQNRLVQYDRGILLPFVRPHWPASSLNALAILRNDTGDSGLRDACRSVIPARILQDVRAHIAETYLLDEPDEFASTALEMSGYLLRRATPFSLQEALRWNPERDTVATLSTREPHAAVLQKRIMPHAVTIGERKLPIRIVTIARGHNLLGAAGVATVPANGHGPRFVYYDLRVV